MNKAFTKEDRDSDDNEDEYEGGPPLPHGKNYITPNGAKRLQKELYQLKHQERPEIVKVIEWAAGNGDRSENGDYLYGKKRLREIDRRVRFLNKRLEAAEIIDPTLQKADEEKVYFGATVTIADEDGEEKTYSIVGVDEVDLTLGRISWLSPLGAALLRGQKGDVMPFRTPKGAREIEIVEVRYMEIE